MGGNLQQPSSVICGSGFYEESADKMSNWEWVYGMEVMVAIAIHLQLLGFLNQATIFFSSNSIRQANANTMLDFGSFLL
ncbi:hypothetical protein VNO80_25370 [Phaseolus coccineus]|uniref:Uncharacterized protein n=1 Tax=Phaseolus coccineus TaxID=3886 RepID=A0AAN9LUP9_PHACN